ncbi:hypothetical protein BCR35DRAFT_304034 [Leucosporidium creatinivorum]|uniref:Mid2 domain-containing protein n=1 Tax=Leucosporidium creatinivorum TaxID=106004 RepID=A0A1Y2FD52_9BASI|nr:hypothetical protein BCR35DRAFT_304034 [Leucosporidium creatinivorum]
MPPLAEPVPLSPTPPGSPPTPRNKVKKDLIINGTVLQPFITLLDDSGRPEGTRLADVLVQTTVPAGETFTIYSEPEKVRTLELVDVKELGVESRIVAPTEMSTLAVPSEANVVQTGTGPAPTDYIETVQAGVVDLGGGTYLLVQATETSFEPTTDAQGQRTSTPVTTLMRTVTYVTETSAPTSPPSSSATSTTAPSHSAAPSSKKTVHANEIAGGIIGGLILLALILLSLFLLLRRRRHSPPSLFSDGREGPVNPGNEEAKVLNVSMSAVAYEGGSGSAMAASGSGGSGAGGAEGGADIIREEEEEEKAEETRDW